MPRISPALLLALCLSANAVHAQSDSSDAAEEDLSTRLQQELTQLENERVRLASELEALREQSAGDHLEALETENQQLRDQLSEQQLRSNSSAENEQRLQQQWFMVGGGTVAGSLLLGFLLGRIGGRRKRSEWLN